MAEREENAPPRISIMVTKGTLDWACPPFIIGSTAAAMGWDASLFFTFYGLALLKKDLKPNISPPGNPAMEHPGDGQWQSRFAPCLTVGRSRPFVDGGQLSDQLLQAVLANGAGK